MRQARWRDGVLTLACAHCLRFLAGDSFVVVPKMRYGRSSVCRECRNAEARAYRVTNRVTITARQRAAYQANAEAERTRGRARYAEHRDERTAAGRERYAANAEAERAEWRAKYAVHRDEINTRRRARRAADPEPIRAAERAAYHRRTKESTDD